MRKQPIPLDPFSLTRIGMANWVTNLVVARELAQAVREQNTRMMGAMRGHPTI
jgi:hypothetical protein